MSGLGRGTLLTGKGRQDHGEILKSVTGPADKGWLRPIVDERHFTLETVTGHGIQATAARGVARYTPGSGSRAPAGAGTRRAD